MLGFARLAPRIMGRSIFGSGEQARRDRLGARGEREAVRAIRRKGYRVLGRNVRVPMGEADIVARAPDHETIVIIEVKTRQLVRNRTRFAPESAVTAAKMRKLQRIASHLRNANGWQAQPMRIDVIGVEIEGPNAWVRWTESFGRVR